MEILRVSPYNLSISATVEMPETSYEYVITNLGDGSTTTGSAMSDLDSLIVIPLSSQYDSEYKVEVNDQEIYADVVRPYVDPNTKGDVASEVSDYAKNEEIARAIIDSVIPQGFYYKRSALKMTGLGADYLPLWDNVKKILKVYENNKLVFDSEDPESFDRAFEITKDKTAITETAVGVTNRLEGAAVQLPSAGSDWLDVKYEFKGFPKTFDYTIIVEHGYKNLPSDIVRAAELLIDDLSCGRLDYYKQYVKEYNTDQFKLKFDSQIFEGTGNIVVDKILSKYKKSIKTLGVL